MIKDANLGPFYVATYNGFLVIENVEGGRTRLYTTADVRNASTFPSFTAADSAAKWGVNRMFPPDIAYFAIFCLPSFEEVPND